MAEFLDRDDSNAIPLLNTILAVVSDLQDKSEKKFERESTRISHLEDKLDSVLKKT